MNKAIRLKPFINPSVACLIGLFSGVAIEKYRRNNFKVEAAKIDIASDPKNPLRSSGVIDIGKDALSTGVVENIMKHGFPSTDQIRSFNSFVLGYDRKTRNALWVYEHLTPDSLEYVKSVDRSNIEFFEDPLIHVFFRASNEDFRKSGYDRGHLAAAGNNRASKELVAQTFILSNVSPQVGKGFNRGIWNRLEQYVRHRARKSVNTWICTGPLFLPYNDVNGKKYIKYEVIGSNDVAVPTHFFKVLVVESSPNVYELECYVLQNKPMDDNLPLHAFQVPLDSIERAAGFLIFDKLPRNQFKRINGLNPYLEKFNKSSPKQL